MKESARRAAMASPETMVARPLFWFGWNSNCRQIDSCGVSKASRPIATWSEGYEKSGHYEAALFRAEKRGTPGFVLEKIWWSGGGYSAIGHWEWFLSEEEGRRRLDAARGKTDFEEAPDGPGREEEMRENSGGE